MARHASLRGNAGRARAGVLPQRRRPREKKGLGDMVASWISTGPNPPISAAQVSEVLGNDVVKQFAAKAGVPQAQAGGLLASLLPTVIDHLTPQGKTPETNAFESALGGLLSSLGK